MSEEKPIIKIVFYKYREAWYRLSVEERHELIDKLLEKYKELDIKQLIMGTCYWSCEEWMFFVVQEFPNIEALQEFQEWIIDIQWPRFADSRLYLGNRFEAETMLKRFVMP